MPAVLARNSGLASAKMEEHLRKAHHNIDELHQSRKLRKQRLPKGHTGPFTGMAVFIRRPPLAAVAFF